MSFIHTLSSGLLPETMTQCRRIIADGGTIVDQKWMDRAIRTMKAQGVYASCKFLGDANMAYKDAGAGATATLYDISGNNNDATAAGAAQPTWTAAQQNGKAGLVFTAATSIMSVGAETFFDFDQANSFSLHSVVKLADGEGVRLLSKIDDVAAPYTGWELNVLSHNFLFYLIYNLSEERYIEQRSTGTTLDDGTTRSLLCTYAGTSAASGVLFYSNGSTVSKAAPVKDGLNASALTNVPLKMGGRMADPGSGMLSFNQSIFSAVLSTAQRTAMESLVNSYYAIY